MKAWKKPRRAIKIMAIITAMFFLSIISQNAFATQNSNDIYPMFGINPQHNFQSPYSAKNNDGHLKDVKRISVTRWIVMDKNYIYAVHPDELFSLAYIVKYNINTGQKVWDTKHTLQIAWTTGPTVFLSNDTFYIYLDDGYYTTTGDPGDGKPCSQTVWAISTKDGKVLWQYNAMKTLENYYHKSLLYRGASEMPVVSKDDTFYVPVSGEIRNTTSIYNAIIAINPDGTTKWIYPIDNGSYRMSISLDNYGNIYTLTSKHIYSITPDGKLRWKREIDLRPYKYTTISIFKNRLYFVGGAKLFAYNTDGDQLWSYSLSNLLETFYSVDDFYSPTIAPNGIIYIPTENWIYSIFPNGTLNWKVKAPNAYYLYLIADKDNYIYFSTGKEIYRLSPSGELKMLYELQNYYPNARVLSSLIYIGPNGVIYTIYQDEGDITYLYIFGNDPFAFLKNPIFITAIVLIIAVPVIYFTHQKIKKKKEVKEK